MDKTYVPWTINFNCFHKQPTAEGNYGGNFVEASLKVKVLAAEGTMQAFRPEYPHGTTQRKGAEDAGFTFKDMLAWDKGHAGHRAQRVSSVFHRRKDWVNEEKWNGWRLANLRPEFEFLNQFDR